MSFNYDLSSSDAAIALISGVRLRIGDTRNGDGPRRDGTNYSDEEITYFLSSNSDDPNAAAAQACDYLAADWASMTDVTIGDYSRKASTTAAAWLARATLIREQAGIGILGRINFDYLEPAPS